MYLQIIRNLLLGFMIGGGLGAKIGAYVGQFSGAIDMWPVVEFGILVGAILGITVAGAFVAFKSELFKAKEKSTYTSGRQVLAS